MDSAPVRQVNAARAIRGLTMAWLLAGAAWAIATAFFVGFGALSALFLAVFAAVSLGVIVVIATGGRTREVWADLSTDKSPEAYLLWTVVAALAACFVAIEGWTLTALGSFSWSPDWLPLLIFGLPIVAIGVRLKDFRRRFWLPRRARREGARTR